MTEKTATDIVGDVLMKDPRARRDAAWLVYKVWRRYTKIFIPFEDFKKIPSPETICKIRRDFQNRQNKFNEATFVAEEGVTYEKQ